jgi:hypothetical protein
MVPYGPYGISV